MGGSPLAAGANTALPPGRVLVEVAAGSAVDHFALGVGSDDRVPDERFVVFFNNTSHSGLSLTDRGVEIDPEGVPAEVQAVRVAVAPEDAAATPLGTVTATVTVDGDAVAGTRCEATGLGSVLVVEIYRRAGAWRLRALGQGYVGGAAELLRVHGVDVDEPDPVAVGPSPGPGRSGAETPAAVGDRPPDLDPGQACARARVMLESAARMIATHTTALELAQARLDEEIGRLGDLAPGSGPGGPRGAGNEEALRARLEADTAATEHHDRDLALLEWEQQHLADQWPRAAAELSARCWIPGSPNPGCDGWLAATLHRPELSLQLPLLIPTGPGISWVTGGGDGQNATATLGAVVRLAACRPGVRTTVDVVDTDGTLAGVARVLAPMAAREGAGSAGCSAHDAFVTADLRELGWEAGMPPADHHVLVCSAAGDAPGASGSTGPEVEPDRIERLLLAATSLLRSGGEVVMVGPAGDPRLVPLLESARRVPAAPGELDDPWVHSRWLAHPPAGPQDEAGWAPYVELVAGGGR